MEGIKMNQKQFTAEQIIVMLQEADVKLSHGRNLAQICREMGITEQSYYRCRREYSDLKAARLKRIKEL
jgi:putative transposase